MYHYYSLAALNGLWLVTNTQTKSSLFIKTTKLKINFVVKQINDRISEYTRTLYHPGFSLI